VSPFTDWLKPDKVESFKADYEGIVCEARCPCGAVTPILFQQGTEELDTLLSHGLVIDVEVQCYSCDQTLSYRTSETAPVVWDSRKHELNQ